MVNLDQSYLKTAGTVAERTIYGQVTGLPRFHVVVEVISVRIWDGTTSVQMTTPAQLIVRTESPKQNASRDWRARVGPITPASAEQMAIQWITTQHSPHNVIEAALRIIGTSKISLVSPSARTHAAHGLNYGERHGCEPGRRARRATPGSY